MSAQAVPPEVRRVILRAFSKKHHLQLQSDAVQYVYATLRAHGLLEDDAALVEAVDALADALVEQHVGGVDLAGFDGLVVSRAALERVYDTLLVETAAGGSTGASVTQGDAPDVARFFAVCDAFEQPRVVFQASQKVFERYALRAMLTCSSGKRPSLLSAANAPSAHLTERYELLRSIVLRNEHFLPPLGAAPRDTYMRLTTTKHLLGRQGESCLLFGRLSTTADGAYALEDTEGSVVLDLAQAIAGEGIFTEGSYMLVEGTYTPEETLRVTAMGHPPSENRARAHEWYGHVDFTGAGALPAKRVSALRAQELQRPDACIAVFSDVHLDHAASLASLRAILQGYEDADFIPLALVLCGNFSAAPVEATGDWGAYAAAFEAFASVLMRFPRILHESHLVFVPGPDDPAATPVLPRTRLPAPLVAGFERRLPAAFVAERLHWMSNPCRLVYFSQEMVVFRDDIMSKMLRSAVRLRHELAEGDLQKFLVSTLLDQAHLCPLPHQVRPILWEYAHSLRLYPMPSAVRSHPPPRADADTACACRSLRAL